MAGESNRPSYFSSVKIRLGSKLPPVAPPPCSSQGGAIQNRTPGTRPPHVPHIRNPRLRQYYLRDVPGLPEASAVKPEPRESNNERTEYTVHPDDTVFSVASQFNAPPNMLPHLSRPPSHSLIPRQRLCIPEAKVSPSSLVPNSRSASDQKSQPAVATPTPLSPSPDSDYDKLLDVEAVPMPDGQLCLLTLPAECSEGEGPAAMPYLKLYARYITDRKGVVSGLLLVTPNKIFFDPHKSHPLVVEQGWEEYLLSCAVDQLASVFFCSDIAHVRFTSSNQRQKGRKPGNPKFVKNLVRRLHGPKRVPRVEPGHAVLEMVSMTTGAEPNLAPPLVPSSQDTVEAGSAVAAQEQEREGGGRGELAAHTAGMLGVAVLSSAATFCCGGLDSGHSVRTELLQPEGREQQKSGVAASKVSSRLAVCSSGSLMFVRLRFHQPPGHKRGVSTLEMGGARTLPNQDAWFALSQQRSDELYAYLTHWRPDLCILEGEEEEDVEGDDEEFVLVDGGEQEEGAGLTQSDSQTGEDWEMVCVEEGGMRLQPWDREPELSDDIMQQSSILLPEHITQISAELPPRTVGHDWRLSFSTSLHGSSLKCLYRKLAGLDSPVLLLIKDSRNQVFGGFLSHPLRPSEKFYGTGETFLFMLHPQFKCFHWTGENSFFIKGDLDSFAIGGGSGHFGLWLDEALYIGRTSPCQTFNNCFLSETDDFRVMELEVWSFC